MPHPSLRPALYLSFSLGLLTLALASWRFLAVHARVLSRTTLWPLGVGLVIAAFPALIAFIAALFTARRIHEPSYELLLVTTLSNAKIAHGHLLSALNRSQILLALALGLTPALAVGMIESAFFAELYRCQPDFSLKNDFHTGYANCVLPSAHVGIIWLLTALGLWGFSWAAVPLGVSVALGIRQIGVVAVAAPVLAVLISLGLFWWWLSPITLTNPVPWIARLTATSTNNWRNSLVFMLLPYALSFVFVRLTYHWARKP